MEVHGINLLIFPFGSRHLIVEFLKTLLVPKKYQCGIPFIKGTNVAPLDAKKLRYGLISCKAVVFVAIRTYCCFSFGISSEAETLTFSLNILKKHSRYRLCEVVTCESSR